MTKKKRKVVSLAPALEGGKILEDSYWDNEGATLVSEFEKLAEEGKLGEMHREIKENHLKRTEKFVKNNESIIDRVGGHYRNEQHPMLSRRDFLDVCKGSVLIEKATPWGGDYSLIDKYYKEQKEGNFVEPEVKEVTIPVEPSAYYPFLVEKVVSFIADAQAAGYLVTLLPDVNGKEPEADLENVFSRVRFYHQFEVSRLNSLREVVSDVIGATCPTIDVNNLQVELYPFAIAERDNSVRNAYVVARNEESVMDLSVVIQDSDTLFVMNKKMGVEDLLFNYYVMECKSSRTFVDNIF